MDTRQPFDVEVVQGAQGVVCRENWRLREERAARLLAGTTALTWTPLFPDSAVIRVDAAVVALACEALPSVGQMIRAPSAGMSLPTANGYRSC